MSLYGHKILNAVNEAEIEDKDLAGIDIQEFVQLIAYDDISRGSEEQIHEFLESELATVLTERNVLNKKTVLKLNMREIDSKRRVKMVAYTLAKKANDPNFAKMVKYRNLMKEHRAAILKKYGAKAEKIAKVAQKEYIKAAKKESDKPEEK